MRPVLAHQLAQALYKEFLQPASRLAVFPRSEHEPNRLGQQAPSHERQRLRRGIIEPLGVVDDAQQRTRLRRLREQTDCGQPDEKPIGRSASASSR
jgi:hypothetical protein